MRRVALVLTLCVLIASLARSQVTASPAEAQSPLAWSACGSGLECATLQVPLNYEKPSGTQIGLALVRRPAADRTKRIGSLLVNPGGPGGSGVDFARAWSAVLDKSIRDRFDIVGFDPRGVGQSTPLECHNALQDFVAADPSPDNQREWDALEKVTEEFSKDCAQKAGEALQFYGTRNVARDLDRIRMALGDAKLTYVGYSYGTSIGQAYAQLFPQNIRAIVLDGAVDLALDTDTLTLSQAVGFERALANFIDDCSSRGDRCRLNARGGAKKAINQVMANAEKKPIPAPDADRPAGPGETLLGIIYPLYSQSLWSALDRAVDDALDGDGSALVNLTDDYLGREGADGGYENQTEMNLAVNCIDGEPSKLPTSYRDYPKAAKRFAEQAPTLGPALANGLTCKFWDVEPDPLTAPVNTGAPPLLVVSTTGDPATPYEWGVAVAEQLGNATLLTYRGEGHTVYGGQDRCVDDAVNAYLIDLKLPPEGTVCGDGPPIPAAGKPVDPGRPAEDGDDGSEGDDSRDTVVGRDGSEAWLILGMGVVALFAVAVAGVVVYGVVRRN